MCLFGTTVTTFSEHAASGRDRDALQYFVLQEEGADIVGARLLAMA
jgi:hypothetical protein